MILYGNRSERFVIRGPYPLADDVQWGYLVGQACSIMEVRGQRKAAEVLQSHPWSLHVATFGMRDQFLVLGANVSASELAALEYIMDGIAYRDVFRNIVVALADSGLPDIRFVVAEIRREEVRPAVKPAVLHVTSESVKQAIDDVESLIRSSRAESAVDRIHTALHGYLRDVCRAEGLITEKDGSMTINALWRRLCEQHPAFKHPSYATHWSCRRGNLGRP